MLKQEINACALHTIHLYKCSLASISKLYFLIDYKLKYKAIKILTALRMCILCVHRDGYPMTLETALNTLKTL